MQVHRTTDHLPAFRNAVITIGTFDGVHEGHKKIIRALTSEAEKRGGESVIISFDPHPRKIVSPDRPVQLINTLEEKIAILSRTGVHHLVLVPFTQDFADQSAEDYIQNFLVGRFHPSVIIIGHDHHFGKERKGNYRLLEEKAAFFNYTLLEIPRHILDEIGVSSTKIRQALFRSDIETANKLLGYDFFFEGRVVRGDRLGRQLGYPTANLEITDAEKIRPGHGVYAVYAQVRGDIKKGMLSIGNRPSLNDTTERIEVHLFDFDREIYGETMKVTVKKFLRPQERYDSLSDLILQMHKDRDSSLSVL